MEIILENILKKQKTVNAFTALFSSIIHGLTPYYYFHIVPDLVRGLFNRQYIKLIRWTTSV
jgi:hypothetical protein